MWQGISLTAVAFLLVDGYLWNSSLLNSGIRLGKEIAIAFGFS
jgi:hypothetical protein